MKCPVCEKEDKKSKVFIGHSTSTLLAWTPYYDEDGKFVNENPNTRTTTYSCSNGHTFITKTQYGKTETIIK